MTIQQVIHDKVFNSAVISSAIYGEGNKNRLSYIKNGQKGLTDRDKERIKDYFEEKYKIILEDS